MIQDDLPWPPKLEVPKPPQNNGNGKIPPGYIRIEIAIFALILMTAAGVYASTVFKEDPMKQLHVTCSWQDQAKDFKAANIQGSHVYFNVTPYIELADQWGYLVGNSMQPTFFEGNVALQKNITPNYHFKAGDIVRYTTMTTKECTTGIEEEQFIIHRIQAVYSDDKIVMEGDNNNAGEVIKRCQIRSIIIGIMFT